MNVDNKLCFIVDSTLICLLGISLSTWLDQQNWTTLITSSKKLTGFFQYLSFFLVRSNVFSSSCFKEVLLVNRIYRTFQVFLYRYFFTLLCFFNFLISFYLFYCFPFKQIAPGWLNPFFSYPFRSENHNAFCKKNNNKFAVNLQDTASV